MTEPIPASGAGANAEPDHSPAANRDFVWEQSGATYALRLSRRRWEDIEVDFFSRPVVIVIGAWVVLAWARFGAQAITSPRALVRFVLVGFYAWIGLSLLMWLTAWLQAGRDHDPGARPEAAPGSRWSDLAAMAIKVGQAHQPLVIGGLALQIIQIIPTGPVTGIIAIGSVVWMGGQLIGAMAAHQQRPVASVAGPTLVAWLPWMATAGSYLWQRLGHLI